MGESVPPKAPGSEPVAVERLPALRVIQGGASSRYRIGELLGEGGMAAVYRAADLSQGGHEVALKRLRPSEDEVRARKARALFDREYHVLSQLAHPRVVRVFDYGVDADGPYYTMELLDGGDLHAQSPMPWQRACSVVRDVCSAISLLHSRRLIHRDLSPRNVRCTSDGQAKLLDFGAMTPMGPVKQIVGTPPICAPELLGFEALDARADLYALGATLYYALTGRHAYPARDFNHLRLLWRQTPPPPSAFTPDVPPALDALVMSMLASDPAMRPASAAETFERLSAIAELPSDELLPVSSAYLHSANLVAREGFVSRVQKKLARARDGRGSATLVLGALGTGRSRMLAASLLEAKLLGFTTLRMDAVDGRRGEYGGVRALASQLLEALPELAFELAAPHAGLLAHAVPELLDRVDGAVLHVFADPQQRRPQVQRALRDWVCAIADSCPLAIGVDDADVLDEPSAAFAALLTDGIGKRSLALIATAQASAAQAPFGALKVLRDASTRLALAPLEAVEVADLVRSLFGDVPHAQTLAHRLFHVSQGNPRDIMLLAQHLVDRGVIRYGAGAWSLPSRIDEAELPSDMTQAHRDRIAALSGPSYALAVALALAPDVAVSFEEAQGLIDRHDDPASVLRCLDELLVAGLVSSLARRFTLAQRALAPMLRAEDPNRDQGSIPSREVLHGRVARMFEARGDDFRMAQHLLRAGDVERGLDVLVEHARSSQAVTDASPDAYIKLLDSLPADWLDTYRAAVALCTQLGRPKRQIYTLHSRVSGLAANGTGDIDSIDALLPQLEHDAGLDLYASLDASLEPLARLGKSFELAGARYAQTPDAERVLQPLEALKPLAQTLICAVGAVSTRLDLELWERLPSLSPLSPVSPALGVVDLLVQGNGMRITARYGEARPVYEALIARATQPDRAGLDESHQRYLVLGVLCGLGLMEAPMGLPGALDRAKAIEHEPLHQVAALVITMLHHLWQGDVRSAERCKQQVELLRLQNSGRQFFESGHLMGELCAYAASDDLVRVKQCIDGIAVMAAQLDSWMAILCYARGEYQRIRGDYESARTELANALALAAPGRHQLWAEMAGAKLKVLDALGRYEEARELGERWVAEGRAAGLDFSLSHLELPLAAVHAALSDRAAAEALCDGVERRLEAHGTAGLNLGLLFETRARVAQRVGDAAAFERFATRCGELYRAHGNRALIAKHGRLLREARRSHAELGGGGPAALLSGEAALTHITAALSACPGPRERARLGLDLMVARSGATGGFLFALEAGGPMLAAQAGLEEPPSGLTTIVAEHLRAELEDDDTTVSSGTATGSAGPLTSSLNAFVALAGEGRQLFPVMIAHRTKKRYEVTGIAVLVAANDREYIDPSDIAVHLSRVWYDSGDVTSVTAWLAS